MAAPLDALSAAPNGAAAAVQKRTWNLPPESELRFEVPPDCCLTLTLLSGSAEIFGAEMAVQKAYTFSDVKLAAFTWYGAQIETAGIDGAYVSEETPMVSYVNTHAQLEARRDLALANEGQGPRVMIAGPTDSGKSTLSSILVSYAARLGRCPVYVDLDVGQGNIAVPGTVGALQCDASVVSVEEGLGSSAAPLSYFYGHDNLGKNPELYKHLLGQLASRVDERLSGDKEARGSGLVINTAGWIDGLGFSLLLHAVQAFRVDVILVMAHDKLHAELNQALYGTGIVIVKLPRSGGVVQRDSKYRKLTRMRRIHQYFYGRSQGPGLPMPLAPSALELLFDEVTVIRVGEAGVASSIAPIGMDVKPDPLAVAVVQPSTSLLHSILAVVHPAEQGDVSRSMGAGDIEDIDPNIVNANVAGFVHVTAVDTEARRLRVLAPCPGALPSRFLILGSIVWVEGAERIERTGSLG